MAQTNRRSSYTFKEDLTMMAAKAVGIDPYLAAEAGEGAKAAINAIRHAAKTKNPKDRAALIRQAQTELRSINAAKHPKVVNAIQARLLALQGRGGDTEIAHLTPGEVVLPRSLQTPQLMREIAAMAARQGFDPRQLTVGHRTNKVNPRTGQREFIDPSTPPTSVLPVYNFYSPPGSYTDPIDPNTIIVVVPRGDGNGSDIHGGGEQDSGGDPGNGGSNTYFGGTRIGSGSNGNSDSNFGPKPANWSNPGDPYGTFNRFTPPGRSPFGRAWFSGTQDIDFAENLQRMFEGLTPEQIELQYGGQRDNTNGLGLSTTGNYKVPDGYWENALKEMAEKLDEVLSHLDTASNQDLYQAYTNAKHLEENADNDAYRLVGILHAWVTESDDISSPQKPLRDFYSLKAEQILNEIKDRIRDGIWDIGGLPTWPASKDFIPPT